MVKNAKNPDGLRKQLAASRTQFYRELPIPFYGFNRPDAKVIEGVVDNWRRQGMMGSANAHYECIEVFSETDFTEDHPARRNRNGHH
jgi:non-heme chloroperoxidase